LPVIANGGAGECVQMRLIAGADLQGRRVDLQKVLLRKPPPDARLQPIAGQKRRAAVGVAAWVPPWHGDIGFHLVKPSKLR
jgi:hypothetical protein